MTNKKLNLNDSVLKLKLSKETLECLNYFDIFTISELTENANLLSENKAIYTEVVSALEKSGLKIDSKLSYTDRCQRNNQRALDYLNMEETRNKINISEVLKSDISILNIPEKAIKQLKQLNINKVEELLIYTPIDLSLMEILVNQLIINIEEELAKYGLRLGGIKTASKTVQDALLNEKEAQNIKETETLYEDQTEKWQKVIAILQKYYEQNGHIFFSRGEKIDDIELNSWLNRQRKNKKAGLLSEEGIKQLDDLQMVWEDLRTKEGKAKKQQILQRLQSNNSKDKAIEAIDGLLDIIVNCEDNDEKVSEAQDELTKIVCQDEIELETWETEIDSSLTIDELKQMASSLQESISALETENHEKEALIAQVLELQNQQKLLLKQSQELDEQINLLLASKGNGDINHEL